MAKQAIKLKVAGKSYAFGIESEKEELYRLAEREVNKFLTEIKGRRYTNWVDADYLAVTALNFAIDKVQMRRSGEVSTDELKRLRALEKSVDDYLNELE